ncbi:UvrABC system protein A [Bacteroidia bacterium]|nr:UvrABC system protein A [Bacteroidia bacterium]GHT80288.1 UvrABC system protein A [Bacteroidia bacterium]
MDFIDIKGAKVHNLKNVSLQIPRNKLVVVTGLSGSGKSTLVFDTLFAEGQRRYVESLSAYTRQFLGRIAKPDVESITGIPPAIAIEQKVNTRNPRSTVGTSTEIYDYLKLLYARIGHTYSPISGAEVKAHTVDDVVHYIASQKEGTRLLLLSPLHLPAGMWIIEKLTLLVQSGLSRIAVVRNGELVVEEIETFLQSMGNTPTQYISESLYIVIARLAASTDEDTLSDYADSVQTAFAEGNGTLLVCQYPPKLTKNGEPVAEKFSNAFEADGIVFEPLTEHLFSFNNPLGACPKCDGYGKITGIDEELVVPDPQLSVYDDAVAPWRGEVTNQYKDWFVAHAKEFNFPIHRPYNQLTKEQKNVLWKGVGRYKGLNGFFKDLESERYKIQNRVMTARYTGKCTCPDCEGARLRKEALYVKVNGAKINELTAMPIDKLSAFFDTIKLDAYEQGVAERTVHEIQMRLHFLQDVGLSYLTLGRLSNTLSGGESQRINLATSLGSSLVGSLYILDEPSIGLHPRDTQQLIGVLQSLRNLGNTVVVVEHDEEIMRAADQIIDMGPLAGRQGGEVMFQGQISDQQPATSDQKASKSKEQGTKSKKVSTKNANNSSLTLQYLCGEERIETPARRRKMNRYIEVVGAHEHNLKNIDVKFPLGGIVAVTGVSGSGKSSLVKNILHPGLCRLINMYGEKAGLHKEIRGDVSQISNVEMVDQNAIGKSSRSNPVTYVKAYDEIRKLFAEQPYAKQCGYGSSHFSFNIEGGRCPECQGDGVIKVSMQFMADVTLVCESCNGKRFKADLLEVKYKGYDINDVLDFTVNQAIEFFEAQPESTAKKITERLRPLQNVGLGYIKLGQSSNTLSGGESQRVKLASFLPVGQSHSSPHEQILFIFDEPTTGLHFHDIKKLLGAFNALVDRGHSVIVVEHNMEVVKCADWVIDLGPEGGENGGTLCYSGTPEGLAKQKNSYTGQYLAKCMTK